MRTHLHSWPQRLNCTQGLPMGDAGGSLQDSDPDACGSRYDRSKARRLFCVAASSPNPSEMYDAMVPNWAVT